MQSVKEVGRARAGRALALATAGLFACAIYGQQLEPVSAGAGAAGTSQVLLNLAVHDKKNHRVNDLKPTDLSVKDDGSAVTLTSLRLVDSAARSGHLITLLFDPIADPEVGRRARAIAAKLLKSTPPNIPVAVLAVESRLRLQQGYTADRHALAQAVNAVTVPLNATQFDLPEKELIAATQSAQPPGMPPNEAEPSRSQALLTALQQSSTIVHDQHADPALAGLLALVESQQSIKERKALLYFTRGRQMDSRAREMLDSIIGAANRAGVSIYVVDLAAIDSGIHEESVTSVASIGMVPGTVQGATGTQVLPSPSQVFKDDLRIVRSAQDSDGGSTRRLAQATGGSYFTGQENVSKMFGELIEDMTRYYEATYLAAAQQYDGKLRSVEVTSLRAGLKIQSSAGYIAMPAQAATGTRSFELPLLKILSEPKPPAELAFHTSILNFGEEGNTLTVEAPLADVAFREDGNTGLFSAHLCLLARIKDKAGNIVDHFAEDTPRRGSLEQLKTVKGETVRWRHHFNAPAGEYMLEAALLDPDSGQAGVERVSFILPPATERRLARRTEDAEAEVNTPPLDLMAGARPYGSLMIAFPAEPAKPLPGDEMQALLAGAAARATSYSAMLPNFLCVEVTNRSTDARGAAQWKHHDRMSELLTYVDDVEKRSVIETEVHGQKSHASREDLGGSLSHGEFGGMLKAVFAASAQAKFTWKATGTLGDNAVDVFDYQVAREHSTFTLQLGQRETAVAFHGEVFIEAATRNVRRITIVAEQPAQNFLIQASSVSVDYDYVVINTHDYLLPVDAEVRLRLGRRQLELNQIQFHNYRRYGSSVKMLAPNGGR